MAKKHTSQNLTLQRSSLIIVITSLVLTFALVYFQFDDLRMSIASIHGARYPLLALAILFSIGTFLPATAVYVLITPKKLLYSRTLLVQTASSFTGKLLPAGTGGLATFTRYLVTQGHSVADASALASVNNALGFLGLLIITIATLLLSRSSLHDVLAVHVNGRQIFIFVAIIVVVGVVLIAKPSITRSLKRYMKALKFDLKRIAASPYKLGMALLCSIAITLCYAAVLYIAARAFDEAISPIQTIIILTIGVAAASVTPTPGGIGAAEAGLVAGLVASGMPAGVALSIALLYRLVSFWLPMIPGFVAFQVALKRHVL